MKTLLDPESRKTYKTLDLCSWVAVLLKGAGFEFRNSSRKTEACYYGWPGNENLLRVGAHGIRRGERNEKLGNVVATVTFNGNCHDAPGTIRISLRKAETMVASAIGFYFLKSKKGPGL